MAYSPEDQYLHLMQTVLDLGDPRMDRTGTGTKALFGGMMRFNLAAGEIPLITTKRVYWKAAVREMLWFLTGNTNIRPLLEVGVTIWTDWPLKAYRQATGEEISQSDFEARIVADEEFAAQWGDLGPVYGKQWRQWQGPDGKTYDQITDVINLIRNEPASRRILFHGWNVADIKQMALPPCHLLYQYQVTSDGKLNGLLFQRSVDSLLGLPFNLVGATALLMMIAKETDLTPGQLVWMGGDIHLYSNHFEQAKEQLSRTPTEQPSMRLLRKAGSINDYKIEDFEVTGYKPHAPISAPVAV